MRRATAYQARRHPFAFGMLVLILSPFLLAYLILFAAFYILAVTLDAAAGRK